MKLVYPQKHWYTNTCMQIINYSFNLGMLVRITMMRQIKALIVPKVAANILMNSLLLLGVLKTRRFGNCNG